MFLSLLSSYSERAWHSMSTSTMGLKRQAGQGRSRHESLRTSGLTCPTTLLWNGNGGTGCGREEEAEEASEVKQDRERWEKWKMSLEKLFASCIEELSLQK